MKKKINTKNFGEKNLLGLEPISGTNELFVGEISVNKNGSRFRLKGIIDNNYKEVVPFGDLHRMIGTRIVNDNIVIIDCVSVAGCYDIGWRDEYGSLLLMKENGEFKLEYNSNATIMYVTNDMLYGANYDASEEEAYCQQYDDTSYPINSFEYNYQDNCLVNVERIDGTSQDELQAYFYSKILPYPDKMLKLKPVGISNDKRTYGY